MNDTQSARQSLEKLRGTENPILIESELSKMSSCLEDEARKKECSAKQSLLEKVPKDGSFWKPFSFLVVTALAEHWGGFPTLGFYMVSMLKAADAPLDPFQCFALIALFRIIVTFFGLGLNKRFKRRPMYLLCCGIHLIGMAGLATYFLLNVDGKLTNVNQLMRLVPIFCMMISYMAFAFGYGSIPFILHVRISYFPLLNVYILASDINIFKTFLKAKGSWFVGVK